LTPDQDEQLRLVQAGGRQLLMIISDVLDVARIEAGAFAVASEPVDLGMLLHQVAGQLAPLAADKALRLSVEVEPQTLVITGDRRAVIQILMNLGGNAIKFTERGSVTLSAAVNAGRVEIAVADTGIGIASHDHDKLFVKFGRIENATGSFAGGTGLGLYLCRLLSDRVGGQIDFVSEPGHGSRFVVSFPASLLRPDGESRTE
jgi:protein-histidine pros-kinase